MKALIYHNPNCGTSRNTLAALEEASADITVVKYLETGWTRPQLEDLLARLGVGARAILRTKELLAQDLKLAEPGVSDAELIELFIAHPVLVERPIVVTDKGAALCRPWEKIKALI